MLTLIALGLSCLPAYAKKDISSLLERQTQAFSDASKSGDAAAMAKLLDPTVIFVNENGDVSSKDDLTSGASPPPPGAQEQIKVTDWQCAMHGNVAVGSFIDDQTGSFHGQPVHAQFRSVETWLKEGDQWRLIGSLTLAVQSDPPSVQLPLKTLQDYVGVYQAAADFKVSFQLDRGQLTASINGGPATPQLAELRDVLFTPGVDRVRRIFQRDADGKVIGFVSRHEGHDIRFTRVT